MDKVPNERVNGSIARHLLKWLVPASIAGHSEHDVLSNPINLAALDSSACEVRVRQGATVLRGETGANDAAVVYWRNGEFTRVKAKAVIFAGQNHTAVACTEYLMSPAQEAAMDETTIAPVVVANVALRKAAPIVDLGYDAYWWGSQYWADFVVADWTSPHRNNPNRQTVLTFYGGNKAPPEEMAAERVKLLTTPFGSYEQSLRNDLGRILAGRNFEFDRDVSAVYVYRWGHGMVYPKPGWPFGAPTLVNGQWVRTPSPRHAARAQLGRISFGAQDAESSPSNESAIGAGLRTVQEVLPFL
jgi:hypothetical protein